MGMLIWQHKTLPEQPDDPNNHEVAIIDIVCVRLVILDIGICAACNKPLFRIVANKSSQDGVNSELCQSHLPTHNSLYQH